MILDSLESSSRYDAFGPRFAHAFAWLKSIDPASMPNGKVEIDGENLYALVMRDHSKPLAEVKWEAHEKYADIQYVAAGTEEMRWCALNLSFPGEYQPEKDFVPIETDVWTSIEVIEGQFALFFPQDAHRPSILVDGAPAVTKVVVKVRLDA